MGKYYTLPCVGKHPQLCCFVWLTKHKNLLLALSNPGELMHQSTSDHVGYCKEYAGRSVRLWGCSHDSSSRQTMFMYRKLKKWKYARKCASVWCKTPWRNKKTNRWWNLSSAIIINSSSRLHTHIHTHTEQSVNVWHTGYVLKRAVTGKLKWT